MERLFERMNEWLSKISVFVSWRFLIFQQKLTTMENTKRIKGILWLLLFSTLSLQAQHKCNPTEHERVMLFNARNTENWVYKLKEPVGDPSGVFSVKDAALRISGEPFGYLRTKGAYSNYVLYLEWRWPEELSNSGIFIHAQQPDTLWPNCIEVQLMAGNAGDFICMGGSDMAERTDKSSRVVKKQKPSNEKPVGEWNVMEVRCEGNTIAVFVNGELQNSATGVSLSSGHICLQSEGKAIEFRNVWLVPLTAQR